jgi:UDP-4-amino-4,6-dideoxy-N-acetyl-beta-L-altrosamine transaminase
MIPYGKQEILQEDIDAVVNVLKSDYLTQGPQVPLFEKAIMNAVSSQYALAVNSATSALHIACLALDVGKGDVVWTTPITFVASANCALYCGAAIDFVDIDKDSYNLSADKLEEKLFSARENNFAMPKVVIVVHLCGQSCDMQKIHTLKQEFGFSIIEDASHAIGGKYQGQPIGNCKHSDITIFSFHPVKVVTTAEGGVATTNDKHLARKMKLFRSHGITKDVQKMTHIPDGPWYYQQIDLGFNYRMTDLQAALGVAQMKRLDEFVSKRHNIAKRYDQLLQNLPITLPWQHSDSYSGLHLYVIRLQLDKIKVNRRQVFESLHEQGIGVNVHYIPIHTQPFYQKMGFKQGDYPQAEQYYGQAISLPMYTQLSIQQQEQVCLALNKALQL